jgi:hypothetical protein
MSVHFCEGGYESSSGSINGGKFLGLLSVSLLSVSRGFCPTSVYQDILIPPVRYFLAAVCLSHNSVSLHRHQNKSAVCCGTNKCTHCFQDMIIQGIENSVLTVLTRLTLWKTENRKVFCITSVVRGSQYTALQQNRRRDVRTYPLQASQILLAFTSFMLIFCDNA